MNAPNPKVYGNSSFQICVIHGGPGVAGEMAPVAATLASEQGVLEPFQTANSVRGQIEELQNLLEQYSIPPATLIGYSWGAWLCAFPASFFVGLFWDKIGMTAPFYFSSVLTFIAIVLLFFVDESCGKDAQSRR
jgi:hypothetical protein